MGDSTNLLILLTLHGFLADHPAAVGQLQDLHLRFKSGRRLQELLANWHTLRGIIGARGLTVAKP
jgi:hypothetical protein